MAMNLKSVRKIRKNEIEDITVLEDVRLWHGVDKNGRDWHSGEGRDAFTGKPLSFWINGPCPKQDGLKYAIVGEYREAGDGEDKGSVIGLEALTKTEFQDMVTEGNGNAEADI